MRGEVLHYDDEQGVGFIYGADGKRYAFERGDLRRLVPITKGTQVEFQADAANAREIFVVRGTMPGAAASFGRDAVVAGPESTGLWSYFRRGLTSNYVNFRGRARRKEFWGFALFATILLILFVGAGLFLDDAAGNLDYGDALPTATIGAFGLFILLTILPGIAITIRRQHDIGLSGWFYLLVFVPYVGNLIILVFALIPSQKHDNKWGPVPYGVRV
jgi:uncharacterized membrane protein YhaH (DUF805 family)/cold shock CspA family protein